MDDEILINVPDFPIDDTTPSEEDQPSNEESTPQDSSEEENSSDEEQDIDSYPIIDENGNEITNPDLNLGYLKLDTLRIKHPKQEEIVHFLIAHVHLSNGEDLYANSEEEYDPRIIVTDRTQGTWEFKAEDPDPIVIVTEEEDGTPIEEVIMPDPVRVVGASIKRIVDSPFVPAWTEERLVYRYILYTDKELADMEFLKDGPIRLDDAEEMINDITEVVADLAGSDIEERVSNAQETIDDLLLTLAEILGGEEE